MVTFKKQKINKVRFEKQKNKNTSLQKYVVGNEAAVIPRLT